MTTKKLTMKIFVNKSLSAKVSAEAFLSQYREWLMSEEVRDISSPILSKFDTGELLPTPALKEIRDAIFQHMLQKENEVLVKNLSTKEKRTAKKFVASIFDSQEQLVYDWNSRGEFEALVKGFDMPQDAQRWVDRRLFDNPNCFGIIQCKGELYEEIERDDSIARILEKPRKASCRKTAATTSRLSFGMKCSQDISKFSRG